MSGKGDRNRSTSAFQRSSYFCETCGKGPSACRCKCPECKAVIQASEVPCCTECSWIDSEARQAEIARNHRALSKLSPHERLMFMICGEKQSVAEKYPCPQCGSNEVFHHMLFSDCGKCGWSDAMEDYDAED